MKLLAKRRRKATFVQNNVHLERHEYEMILVLIYYCQLIELVPKSNIAGVHTPDLLMDGVPWEMKRAKGNGKYTIQKLIHKALHQSENIIIDIRYSKMPEEKCLRELTKIAHERKKIRRLLVIASGEKVIDIL